MARIRPEMIKGIGVLGAFLVLIVVTSILLPIPISQSKYVHVNLQTIKYNEDLFYLRNVSSSATAESVLFLHPNFLIFTVEGVPLQIREDLYDSPIVSGNHILFRGQVRNQTIVIHEFYVLDYSSSIIRSIPGIIIFVVTFFFYFKFDFKQLAFVPRREEHA